MRSKYKRTERYASFQEIIVETDYVDTVYIFSMQEK